MPEIKQKRPGIVLAAAIMLFVFGAYGLLGLCALATPFIQDMMPQPPQVQGQPRFEDPMKKLTQEVPSFNYVQGGVGVCTFLLGIIKIWAGFGVLKLQPTARKVAIMASLATIVLMVAQTVYNSIFFIPVYTRLLDEQVQAMGPMPMPFDIFGFMKNTMWIGQFVGLAFSCIVWVTIIFMLNTKSARNAFSGISAEPADEPESERRSRYDGYDDEDEAYPPAKPKSSGDTGITDRPS